MISHPTLGRRNLLAGVTALGLAGRASADTWPSRPIKLVVPEGSMLNPKNPAAVVAGNVEISQVVTDTLFAATGRLAPSQGTMNNFTFGNDRHQYYETICGGSGAGPDHDGTSAVQ